MADLGERLIGKFRTMIHDTSAPQKFSVDRRAIERAWKLMDQVIKLCQQPRMNLKNSPPYILDILPDMHQHVKSIYAAYDDRMQVLAANDYFEVYLESLIVKCQKCVKLFKDNKERMFDESSSCRRSLIRTSLIFSHMIAELKALFPHGTFTGDNYRITKGDAAEWWKRTFPDKYSPLSVAIKAFQFGQKKFRFDSHYRIDFFFDSIRQSDKFDIQIVSQE